MAKPSYRHLSWDPGGQPIPFVLGHQCLRELHRMIRSLAPDRILVLTEATLARKLGLTLRQALTAAIPFHIVSIPAGESSKTLATLDSIAEQAMEAGLTRQSLVVSFGGGLVCNLAGMLAAGLFRGVRLLHMPTTLLAMHDTVTSLKQAVNTGGCKNLFGVYHRPAGILCDVQFCETLARDAVQAALVEIVKNGLILGEPFLTAAQQLCQQAKEKLTPQFFLSVIESGVAAKRSLMLKDPWEKKDAILFEYGHTVGHAIEVAGLKLSHGNAVYWGMKVAAETALLTEQMSSRAFLQHGQILQWLEPMTAPKQRVSVAQLMRSIGMDNKRGHVAPKRDHIQMVLLRSVANPARTDNLPLVDVPKAKLAKALKTLPFVD